MMYPKMKQFWSCSYFSRHQHKWRWTAWLCAVVQGIVSSVYGTAVHLALLTLLVGLGVIVWYAAGLWIIVLEALLWQ